MTDTIADTEARRWIEILLARVNLLERELAKVKEALPPSGAITLMAASGTGSLRDPGILKQEHATGTRGYGEPPAPVR